MCPGEVSGWVFRTTLFVLPRKRLRQGSLAQHEHSSQRDGSSSSRTNGNDPGRVTEPCRSCRLLPSALCSARPVRRACSGELLVELHHLIRLDHHEKVRSEGTLSDSFIPFRASVWVHVLWSPAKHVCPLSYWRGRAEWVQLPVDCVCNYPRWSFASACRIYATLGLPRPGAHISGPR